MDNLNISTGEKRLTINNDPNRVLVFNPSDVLFAEKFYRLIGDFEQQLARYRARSEELDRDKTTDSNGLPANAAARFDLLKEACNYVREQIDGLFGIGTSAMVFGDALSLDAYKQFFDGITPYIQTVRTEKVARYTNKKPKRTL